MVSAGAVLNNGLRKSALIRDPTGPPRPVGVNNSNPYIGVEGNAMFNELYDDDDVGSVGAYDIIGDDDDDEDIEDIISGDGMSEIIGKDLTTKQARRLKKLLMLRRGAAVVQRSPSRRRRYPLGFTPTDIATTITTSIPSAPQQLFRPERLIVPSEIAPDIGIVDIKVGTQSQYAQNTEVPAAVFSEVAIGATVHFDSAEVGNQVYVQARNKSASTVNFTAALIGTVAK